MVGLAVGERQGVERDVAADRRASRTSLPTRRGRSSAAALGDLVVWAQEHLVAAGFPVKISGEFKYRTYVQVAAFQARHGLTADGQIGPDTWAALLRYKPVHVDWSLDRHLAVEPQLRSAAAAMRPAARRP